MANRPVANNNRSWPVTAPGYHGRRGCARGAAGRLSCREGDRVIINLTRWLEGTTDWDGSLADYRAMVINHEVGHALGHGHLGCPGPGQLAPVMMQQTKGLDGCVGNPWPFLGP